MTKFLNINKQWTRIYN